MNNLSKRIHPIGRSEIEERSIAEEEAGKIAILPERLKRKRFDKTSLGKGSSNGFIKKI